MVSGQLAVSPATLALGRVKIGGSQTQSATLVNSATGTGLPNCPAPESGDDAGPDESDVMP